MTDPRTEVLAVIPARYAAQRFPGKPLIPILGKPLVQWVWEAARRAQSVTRVVVATDHEKIARAVRSFGGEAIMTSSKIASGTDRVAAVSRMIPSGIVINIQGDEPLLRPSTIDALVETLKDDPQSVMATAVRKPAHASEWRDPNVVKVALDRLNYALYFSRSPIPSDTRRERMAQPPRWVHIGLYGFRRGFLFRFAGLSTSPLEQAERLEQLRALENGCSIKTVIVHQLTCGVDRPADVRRVEALLTKSLKKERSA